MRATISAFMAMISLTGYIFPQPAKPETAAETEITHSIEEINHAYVVRAPAPFEKLYADNFVSIRSQPVYNSKQQLVAMMKADAAVLAGGGKLDFETISYDSDKPDIHVFGTTAVVNVAKRNLWSYLGSKCLSRYQATETWVATPAGWRLLASHATTFQCERVPWMPLHRAVAAIGSITTPPTLTEGDARVKVLFDRADASQRVFAQGFVFTDLEGTVRSGQSAALSATELINSVERENEAIVASGDTAVLTFRTFRKKGALRAAVQVSVVAAKSDGKWRLLAAHATW